MGVNMLIYCFACSDEEVIEVSIIPRGGGDTSTIS